MKFSNYSTGTYSWTTSSTATSTSSKNWWNIPVGGWTSYPVYIPPKKREVEISEKEILDILEGKDDD